MTKKKIKSGQTVIVNNNGTKEVGLCKKVHTKKGIQYYDVLLERGAFLEGITDNKNSSIHLVLMNLKPLDETKELKANINPDKYDFELKVDSYFPTSPFSEEEI